MQRSWGTGSIKNKPSCRLLLRMPIVQCCLQHADDDYSRRGNFAGSLSFYNMFLIYSPERLWFKNNGV